jgi:4-hydroxythreonine-4-phosphate dehydrogenase
MGRASLAYIDAATELAARGAVDGIVTCPVSKEAVGRSLPGFTGHTEHLAERLGAHRVVMMLTGGGLRVGLVTSHLSLRDALGSLSVGSVVEAALVMDRDLRLRFGIRRPRIAVAAVNPHASESGLFGDEERRVIAPAIAALRRRGVLAVGPEVADVVFRRQLLGEFDAVLAMHHDQGCIPVKTLAFESGVNVTLGLPVVRTSPDHGTAFDIAGKGLASESSLLAAVQTAALMCRLEARKRGAQ